MIDELTLFDVVSLRAYWKDHPPVAWAVQALLGSARTPNRVLGSKRRPAAADDER